MKNIYLQNSIKKQLEKYVKSPPQALLLQGKTGVGLGTIAKAFSEQLTDASSIITLSPEESGAIKIKTIRELYGFTRTKHFKTQVVVIDNADSMQHPAQNALLKHLEEPPEHVVFVLTSHSPQLLLPTIVSRVQSVDVLPISLSDSTKLTEKLQISDDKKRAQVLFIGLGLPAEICRLASDKDYFVQRSQSMQSARRYIQSSQYERLVTVFKLGNDKIKAFRLINDCIHIVENSLKQKPSKQLAQTLAEMLDTQEKLLSDGNIKVQFLKLSLGI